MNVKTEYHQFRAYTNGMDDMVIVHRDVRTGEVEIYEFELSEGPLAQAFDIIKLMVKDINSSNEIMFGPIPESCLSTAEVLGLDRHVTSVTIPVIVEF